MDERTAPRVLCFTAVLVALVVLPAAALADVVVSKGYQLHGKVTTLDNKGLTFEPEFGTGDVVIKWEDVDDVSTDGPVQILYGEEEEVEAPVQGKHGTLIQTGGKEVDVTTILMGVTLAPTGETWTNRMRSSWRYWTGHFDLGFNYQQATTNTTGFSVGFGTTRSKGPTRLILAASYLYSTEKKQDQPGSTIQDDLKGLIRGEYDITPRVYGFGSVDGEYNGVQHLSIRTVPKLGAGYTFFLEDLDAKRQNFLKGEAGIGYVYQRFFGGDHNEYFTVAFGLLATYFLPYDTEFDWRFDYLPAVDNWADNYLLRSNASLTVPIVDPISGKFQVIEEYNSQPAPDTQHNNLYLVLGISLAW